MIKQAWILFHFFVVSRVLHTHWLALLLLQCSIKIQPNTRLENATQSHNESSFVNWTEANSKFNFPNVMHLLFNLRSFNVSQKHPIKQKAAFGLVRYFSVSFMKWLLDPLETFFLVSTLLMQESQKKSSLYTKRYDGEKDPNDKWIFVNKRLCISSLKPTLISHSFKLLLLRRWGNWRSWSSLILTCFDRRKAEEAEKHCWNQGEEGLYITLETIEKASNNKDS